MSSSGSRKDRVKNEGFRRQTGSRNARSALGDSSRSTRLSRSPAPSLNKRGQASHDYERFNVQGGEETVVGSKNIINNFYDNEAQRHRTYHQPSSEVRYGASGLYPPTFPHQFPSVMAAASGSIGSHASEIIWVISPGFRMVQGNVVALPPEGTISDVVFKFLAPQLRNTQVSVPESGATPAHHSPTPSTTKTGPPSSTHQNPSRVKSRQIRKSKKKKMRKKKCESGGTKAGCEQQT